MLRRRNVARIFPLASVTAAFSGCRRMGLAFLHDFSRFVHRRRRPHPDRQDERRTVVVLRCRPRRVRHLRSTRTRRGRPRRGRARDHGPGADGRPGPGAQPSGGGQGGHPDERSVGERQQGVPVRAQLDLPGESDDRCRRRRHRGGRRHGVDDQCALHRRRRSWRLQVRQHRAARRHHRRRSVVLVRCVPDGARHRPLRVG